MGLILDSQQPSFSYNTNNHITGSPTGAPQYDAAGDITTGTSGNTYLYDAEGRICAVNAAGMMTGYVYDADGNRVAKGPITVSGNCDPKTNGFEGSGQESDYITNQSGQTVTKTTMGSNGAMQWDYTNVYADGQLFATYDAQGLHFQLDDWLGTRRVTTNYAGVVEQICASLPYGDQLTCSGSQDAPNEQHFTGKTHDSESGLDYFGARYYSANDARFMSPDWSAKVEPVPYAKLGDPQSLNLYGYMLDSPLDGVDQDGHETPAQAASEAFCAGDDPITAANEAAAQQQFALNLGKLVFSWISKAKKVSDIVHASREAINDKSLAQQAYRGWELGQSLRARDSNPFSSHAHPDRLSIDQALINLSYLQIGYYATKAGVSVESVAPGAMNAASASAMSSVGLPQLRQEVNVAQRAFNTAVRNYDAFQMQQAAVAQACFFNFTC